MEVRHSDVQAWVGELSADLGPSMVRQIHLVLAGVLRYSIRDGRLANPRPGPCPGGECGEQGDVVMVLAYTGLRWGELAALRVNRIDFARRRIDVVRAISEPRGVIIWGTPENHERRSVPFPDLLTAA